MRKLLAIIILSMLWCNTSFTASLYGSGDLKISKNMFDRIYKYLGSGVKNKKGGAKQSGRGTYFAISLSGKSSGAGYCPWSQCQDQPIETKSFCERNAKKQFNQKEKCKLMFKGNTLKWNGSRVRLSQKDDIEASLARVGITVIGSNNVNLNKEIKKPYISKKKTINSTDVASQLEQLNKLYKSGALTKDEFGKAKKKLLN